ncbi:hypothetical protein MBLNU459_g7160t1 [Dothideomycetes sp. NU459]
MLRARRGKQNALAGASTSSNTRAASDSGKPPSLIVVTRDTTDPTKVTAPALDNPSLSDAGTEDVAPKRGKGRARKAKASGKSKVLPIREVGFGNSPTETLEVVDGFFSKVTDTVLPLRLVAVPPPPNPLFQTVRAFDESFTDYAEILGMEGSVTEFTQAQILAMAETQKALYIDSGETEESHAWHRRRVRKIVQAAAFFSEHGCMESGLDAEFASFVGRRKAFQEMAEEWTELTLQMAPHGYPHSQATAFCGDETCPGPCPDLERDVRAHLAALGAKGSAFVRKGVERGCPVGTYRHDPLRVQRIVYCSFSGGTLEFRLGRYTTQGYKSEAVKALVTRADISPFPEFPNRVTTRAELRVVHETLVENSNILKHLRLFEDFQSAVSASRRCVNDMQTHKRRHGESLLKFFPLLPTGWDSTTALPIFDGQRRVVPLGHAFQATNGRYHVAEVSLPLIRLRPATAKESEEITKTDWRPSRAGTQGLPMADAPLLTKKNLCDALGVAESQLYSQYPSTAVDDHDEYGAEGELGETVTSAEPSEASGDPAEPQSPQGQGMVQPQGVITPSGLSASCAVDEQGSTIQTPEGGDRAMFEEPLVDDPARQSATDMSQPESGDEGEDRDSTQAVSEAVTGAGGEKRAASQSPGDQRGKGGQLVQKRARSSVVEVDDD